MGFVHPATADVRFTGGDGCVYRLHLAAGPFVRHTLPLAISRGHKTPVELFGWNLASRRAEIDGSKLAVGAETAELGLPGVATELPLALSDIPEVVETEPNDSPQTAQAVEVPTGISGRIGCASDEDRFAFPAVKGRTYSFKVTAGRVGSTLDAWLKVESGDGRQLATNDDAGGSRDSELQWTAPADGRHIVAIGDVSHHGGEDFLYRLAIMEPVPSVSGVVTAHALAVKPGKTVDLKTAVKRANGFKAKLQLIAKNLPEGVTASVAEVPDKDGDVTLKVSADVAAMPASQPFSLALREVESGREHPVRYSLVSTSENNGVPQGYIELVFGSTEQLWVTVLAEPVKDEPKK
jgi:hypothetical protein